MTQNIVTCGDEIVFNGGDITGKEGERFVVATMQKVTAGHYKGGIKMSLLDLEDPMGSIHSAFLTNDRYELDIEGATLVPYHLTSYGAKAALLVASNMTLSNHGICVARMKGSAFATMFGLVKNDEVDKVWFKQRSSKIDLMIGDKKAKTFTQQEIASMLITKMPNKKSVPLSAHVEEVVSQNVTEMFSTWLNIYIDDSSPYIKKVEDGNSQNMSFYLVEPVIDSQPKRFVSGMFSPYEHFLSTSGNRFKDKFGNKMGREPMWRMNLGFRAFLVKLTDNEAEYLGAQSNITSVTKIL